MNERNKEFAIAAGLAKPYVSKTRRESGVVIKDIDALQKFADLIRADEREALIRYFDGHYRGRWSEGQIIEALEARGNT